MQIDYMQRIGVDLDENQHIYFASDFHLGAPDKSSSKRREQVIVSWLEEVRADAAAIFLLGDLFDFWFEYKHALPKGFIRFQGKLAELSDAGVPLYIFTGNHDLWMFDYFQEEFNIPVLHKPVSVTTTNNKLYLAHGDGLGPGDYSYKFLKKIFTNKVCQWAFRQIHPDLGIRLANSWSNKSRISSSTQEAAKFLGEDEWLWSYAKEIHEHNPHDFYIFGHRHLPMICQVGKSSYYFNLGEWVNYFTYGKFNGKDFALKTFKNLKEEDYSLPVNR